MVFKYRRRTLGLRDGWYFDVALFFRPLDTAFDVANRIGIFIHPRLVRYAELLLETRELSVHRIQNALGLIHSCLTRRFVGAAAIAKEPFKHRPRIPVRRQGLCLAAPRKSVGICATEIAGAG